MATEPESKKAVYAALLGNVLVAIVKFGAALLSGSSSMMSEAAHSLVDTGNEALLLYGYAARRRSAGSPAIRWATAASSISGASWWRCCCSPLGAGVSFYEGIIHIRSPRPIENVTVELRRARRISFFFEAGSWWVALRQLPRGARARAATGEAVRRSKDPPAFMVLFEDSAALIGIAIAAAGIFLADRTGIPELDGVASLLIGVVLATAALLVARESKGLLIGERASDCIVGSIAELARNEPGVEGSSKHLHRPPGAGPDRGGARPGIPRRSHHDADRAGRRIAGETGAREAPRSGGAVRQAQGDPGHPAIGTCGPCDRDLHKVRKLGVLLARGHT